MYSVFVPCYNEEKRLEKNILRVHAALLSLKKPFELVIVDDGSTDQTKDIGKKLATQHKEILYQFYKTGPSRRENLAEAFRTAKGTIIAFMDLDLSADLSSLSYLFSSIEKGNDIAIGSRYKDQKAERSLFRLFVSGIYNLFMRTYFGSAIKDHQCGFKAFEKKKLFVLLDAMGYDTTFVRGWFWDTELLLRAQKKGYSIDEFPVVWKEGKESTFSIGRELRMIPYVLRLRGRL